MDANSERMTGGKSKVESKDKRSLVHRLVRRVVYKHYGRNLLYELQLRALRDAADYAQANMSGAQIFEYYSDYISYAVEAASGPGLFLEFGVAGGNSARKIASRTERIVHGFDSFKGLPEAWSGHVEVRGAFSKKGRLPDVPSNVTLHVGWFEDVLPGVLSVNAGPVSFVHIDCDIYSSAQYILNTLRPRLVPGTVLLFDEYFNYPGWRLHEFKAWQEFVAAENIAYEYLAFTAVDGCVAVRITSKSI